jgi:hypothetical protein
MRQHDRLGDTEWIAAARCRVAAHREFKAEMVIMVKQANAAAMAAEIADLPVAVRRAAKIRALRQLAAEHPEFAEELAAAETQQRQEDGS